MKVALGPVQRTSSIGVPEEDFGVGLVSVPVECPNKGRAGAKTPGKALRESAKCTHPLVFLRDTSGKGEDDVLDPLPGVVMTRKKRPGIDLSTSRDSAWNLAKDGHR